MPFIVWGAGRIPAGKTDTTSVITATDLFPSFCALAGINTMGKGDGENRSTVLTGKPSTRKKEIYWEYGRNDVSFNYPKVEDRSPFLAIREGKWKLLMNRDGSGIELYDISIDKNETKNLAGVQTKIVEELKAKLLKWWKDVPALTKK